jgi:ubiquinone/menaquinone biosynthesis C-methylase UbiE
VTHEEALELLRPAEISEGETWAELGAGSGTFTSVLAELVGVTGKVYAVDKDKRALSYIKVKGLNAAPITTHQQDFTKLLTLENLDGILMANALHFVRDQASLLRQLRVYLKPKGKFVVIEYDIARANPWVPFPLSFENLKILTSRARLQEPVKVMTRGSRYHREMYVAVVNL